MLVSLSLPGVEIVYSRAFTNAHVQTLFLPDCRSIGYYGITYNAVTKVSLPMCEYLGGGALAQNTSMSFCCLPKCSLIGDNCFHHCSMLMSLYLFSTKVPYIPTYEYDQCFDFTPIKQSVGGEYGSIFVRQSLVDAFMAHPGWYRYSERIVGLTDEQIAAVEEELDYD